MKHPAGTTLFALSLVFLVGGQAIAQDLLRPAERVANEGTIGDKWMLAEGSTLAVATYPPQFADQHVDVCMGLGYRINPDGSTSDYAVLKQWNGKGGEDEPEAGFWQAFAEASADAVAQWRFAPRPEVAAPRSTYTVATLLFNGSKEPRSDLAAQCKIEDLASVVQERKARFARRSVETHDLERANRAGRARDAMNGNPGIRKR